MNSIEVNTSSLSTIEVSAGSLSTIEASTGSLALGSLALGLIAGGFGLPLASALPTGSTMPTGAGTPATDPAVPVGGQDNECGCPDEGTGVSTGSAALAGLAGLALGGLTFGLLS
ncbi:hypothetical protein [Rhodococcus spongiicola]|uniref:Uncharacterized protein n=1 Tax=Rhodococcus spongiicola TaxID=2487352 RepID=A0A3S3BIX9_9NOCA|nr:hypothetical protein [Rhodococcus spongiicola]RVW02385.1 hypothetical protein EF834_12370 [Rhodococcus spongiicola]